MKTSLRRLGAVKPLIADLFGAVRFFFRNFKYLKKTVVFDIDNTLADTWRSLVNVDPGEPRHYSTESSRLHDLPVRAGSRSLFVKLRQAENTIVVLSARPVEMYRVSADWLRRNVDNEIGARPELPLVLVRTPYSKVFYWLPLKFFRGPLVVVDDLSYGHEEGRVLYYNSLLSLLAYAEVCHVGFSELEQLNQVNSDTVLAKLIERIENVFRNA